jgi:hypothetical protein
MGMRVIPSSRSERERERERGGGPRSVNIRYVTWFGVLLLIASAATSEAQVLGAAAESPAVASRSPIDGSIERSEGPKSGATATLFGILLPGGGHFYAAESGRGAIFLVGTAFAFSYAFSDPRCKRPFDDVRSCELEEKNQFGLAASLIATAALYGFSVWDAHRAAHRTNVRRGLAVGVLEIRPHLAIDGRRRASGGLGVRLRPESR